jgi:serine/threonine-protein kinase RsbW
MSSKTPANYSITVESRMSAVNEVYNKILSCLQENGYGKDDIFAIHLTFEEAFYNAVKHGNNMDPDKKVTVDFAVDNEKIEMSVKDEGQGFNPDVVADPRFGDNLFKPGGRGLLLMNSYMDVVKFNETGNSVYMVRYKEKPRVIKSSNQMQKEPKCNTDK